MSNNNNVNKDNDTRKIITMIVMICTLMLGTTGATYAYFALSATNNVATGTAATVSLKLEVSQAELKSPNNTYMVPQLENYLGTAMNSTNKCVDGNGNVVCKVYTITITNESNAAVSLNGTLQFLAPKNATVGANTYTNLYWRKTTNATTLGNNTSVKVTNSSSGAISSSTDKENCSATGNHCSQIYDISAGTVCAVATGTGCSNINLAVGGSTSFNIVIWINETNSAQNNTDKGIWEAIIKFEGKNGTGVTSTITSAS